MLFNSFTFMLAFLPLSLLGYFSLNRTLGDQAGKLWLVAASLLFYSWWNPVYLPLILGSMLFNFYVGGRLGRMRASASDNRRMVLIGGVALNLGLLGYFKYADFFIDNLNWILQGDLPLLHLILPLAISFFTFQQIAYLVDSYRGETREYSFFNYALFVTYFPQLIAGPIVHHSEMMPQFADASRRALDTENIARGVFLFSLGLFKKVVVADTLAIWATNAYDVAASVTFVESWVASLAYTLQLYFDFSGYTDMAMGAALMFNIKLPVNFAAPYKALDLQDFWRRWHVTLGRFLRDYVYIPLGGNRNGEARTWGNLFLTFLLGGLWHGAGWTFVMWGALHGAGLVVHRWWNRAGLRLPNWLAWCTTFLFVHITWVFFRATSFSDAVKILRGMLGLEGVVLRESLAGPLGFLRDYGVEFGVMFANVRGTTAGYETEYLLFLAAALLAAVKFRDSNELAASLVFNRRSAVVGAVLVAVAIICMSRISEFLYFNF